MRNTITMLLLYSGIVLAQQTEIDGKLKVKGEVDVSGNRITNLGAPTATTDAVNTEFLQSALSDIGPYEFKTVIFFLSNQFAGANQGPSDYRKFSELESSASWKTDNFDTYISNLSSAGWELFHINSPDRDGSWNYIVLYTFRKKVN